MNKKFLRTLIEEYEDIKKYILSDRQWQVVKYIRDRGPMCSDDIAIAFDTSIPGAGVILNKIFVKGYLSRQCLGDPSGGNKYEYTYCLEED